MPIADFATYGELIYSLSQNHPNIQSSTLALIPIGATLAKLEGQISWRGDIILDVWELVDFDAGRILNYSYELYRPGEKIAWYDPTEHSHIPDLAATYPHHKHTPPNIKQNRLPAPGISFERPNLPFLIAEIERDLILPT